MGVDEKAIECNKYAVRFGKGFWFVGHVLWVQGCKLETIEN